MLLLLTLTLALILFAALLLPTPIMLLFPWPLWSALFPKNPLKNDFLLAIPRPLVMLLEPDLEPAFSCYFYVAFSSCGVLKVVYLYIK